MFDKIQHIGYYTADLDAAVAWFRQGFGAERADGGSPAARYTPRTYQRCIWPPPATAHRAAERWPRTAGPPQSLATTARRLGHYRHPNPQLLPSRPFAAALISPRLIQGDDHRHYPGRPGRRLPFPDQI